jgi:hypothetical protein
MNLFDEFITPKIYNQSKPPIESTAQNPLKERLQSQRFESKTGNRSDKSPTINDLSNPFPLQRKGR